MSKNPLVLAVMFFLELAALGALIYWGWTQFDGILRVVMAVGVPLIAAAIWGIFRVPGEPGEAPVAVPGRVRLTIEAAFFISAVAALYAAGQPTTAAVLGIIVVLEYLASYDRVLKHLSGK